MPPKCAKNGQGIRIVIAWESACLYNKQFPKSERDAKHFLRDAISKEQERRNTFPKRHKCDSDSLCEITQPKVKKV